MPLACWMQEIISLTSNIAFSEDAHISMQGNFPPPPLNTFKNNSLKI